MRDVSPCVPQAFITSHNLSRSLQFCPTNYRELSISVYKAGAERVVGDTFGRSGVDMSAPSPSTPASATTTIRVTNATADLLRKTAAQRGVTVIELVAELADGASRPKVHQPAAVPSPAAANKASPAAQQKTSGSAVLSHATLGSKPKAYDYFTGLDEQSRAWMYPRLMETSVVCGVFES